MSPPPSTPASTTSSLRPYVRGDDAERKEDIIDLITDYVLCSFQNFVKEDEPNQNSSKSTALCAITKQFKKDTGAICNSIYSNAEVANVNNIVNMTN